MPLQSLLTGDIFPIIEVEKCGPENRARGGAILLSIRKYP